MSDARSYRRRWTVDLKCAGCGATGSFTGITSNKSAADSTTRHAGWSLGKLDRCPACKAKRRKAARGGVR